MHGLYQIKVVDTDGRAVCEYHGETHPLAAGKLVMPDGYHHDVISARHVLKNGRNGGGPVYITFSHVELVVTR